MEVGFFDCNIFTSFFFVYVINFLTDNFPQFFNSKKCNVMCEPKKNFKLWLSCFRAPGQP